MRARLIELTDAMRAYVVKVKAWADPEEPGSEALADTLLLPLIKWKGIPTRPNRADDAPAADEAGSAFS